MPPFPVPPDDDPIRPGPTRPLRITVDGRDHTGRAGQTLAGVVLGDGTLTWRRTSVTGTGRGIFCGIGVCFDCLATVNGEPDVRTCQRRAVDGDVVETQHHRRPAPPVNGPTPGVRDDD